ncbi:S-layer homology domain-containing protein [Peptoniphilus harei]|uniref:S-layer homology domain-containing protein n=1 Tax=Peptoniphilus harei TaxID=54005 RepID=UPI002549F68C|nr:S-layer homology domain-containing protein [Peptoniphilus harei]MDK7376783.1 S-layer homology domain-containing protein [Peptoniphilus harei]MDK7678749.1 S-layer homology domain-containing protein [Peptoniphilus harei]
MNKIKKILAILCTFALILPIFSPLNVFAEEGKEKVSSYFCQVDEDGNLVNKINEIIKDNYWSNLKEVNVETIDSDENFAKSSFKIALPKYLLDPDNTRIQNYATHIDFSGMGGSYSYNFGIVPNWSGVNPFCQPYLPATQNAYMPRYYELPKNESKNEVVNPLNFDENKDFVTKDEIEDTLNKLKFLADLKKKDSKDSKKIDELKQGDSLTLDFKLSAPWFNRFYKSAHNFAFHVGGNTEGNIMRVYNSYAISDAEILFDLKIPEGIELVDKDLKAEVNGLGKYTDKFSTEIKQQDDCLLISLRKKSSEIKKYYDLINEEKDIDLSNVSLEISGLKVANNANTNKDITINGYVSGMYDHATSETEKFYKADANHNSHYWDDDKVNGTPGKENSAMRTYWSFAAVQDPAGLDEAAPEGKPNLISYTFKVKAGEVTPTPTPIPEPEVTPSLKIHEYTPTYPVYVSVDKKEVINTHDQYIFGYPDDTIRPDGDMTRAEAIAVVARLQKLDLSDKSSKIYKDTKADMWYNGAINAAYREGYLLEKEGENIRPNDKITRAELAELISHIDKKNNTVAPFEDVKGHKFEAAINQAYGNERIKGYPDGTFKPDNTITRAEVATMLNKLYDRYPDEKFIDANQDVVHNYKDMSHKGHWGYYELVEAYHSHNYLRLSNNMEEWKDIIK